MKISVCLLTYNRLEVLKENLADLSALTYKPLEILLVDNHSSDGTHEYISRTFKNVRYFRMNVNLGATARNVALTSATGEIIICLDDDVLGLKDCHLREVLNLFQGSSNLGAVNFKVVDYYSRTICNWVHHCKEELYSHRTFLTYELTEGAVAFRRETVLKAGLYDETFFISHEGIDLALRIMDLGYEIIYYPGITVLHKHSSLGRKDWLNYYYDTRNLFYVAGKLFPMTYGLKYLIKGLIAMLLYSLRDGFVKYWIKGVTDGTRLYRLALENRDVLSKETMAKVRDIDRMRPELLYMLKRRLLKSGARL